jgi:hypothetical protein
VFLPQSFIEPRISLLCISSVNKRYQVSRTRQFEGKVPCNKITLKCFHPGCCVTPSIELGVLLHVDIILDGGVYKMIESISSDDSLNCELAMQFVSHLL